MARRIVVPLCAVLALSGCALGPRPTVTSERRVDDAAIDAVLDRLESASGANFTAVYSVASTQQGASPADVTVAHSSTETYIVFTTGGVVSVEYVTTDGEQRTCAAGQTECVAGLDETRISNLGISSSFWGPSTAAKLRADGSRNVADAIASTATLAGQPATCTAVNVGVPSVAPVEYCAVDAGPLATYRGADATIELVSYSPG